MPYSRKYKVTVEKRALSCVLNVREFSRVRTPPPPPPHPAKKKRMFSSTGVYIWLYGWFRNLNNCIFTEVCRLLLVRREDSTVTRSHAVLITPQFVRFTQLQGFQLFPFKKSYWRCRSDHCGKSSLRSFFEFRAGINC